MISDLKELILWRMIMKLMTAVLQLAHLEGKSAPPTLSYALFPYSRWKSRFWRKCDGISIQIFTFKPSAINVHVLTISKCLAQHLIHK